MYNYSPGPVEPDNYRVTAVTTPVVTLDELKRHLGIYETDFDTQLNTVIIPAATSIVSSIMGEFPSNTTVQAFYPRIDSELVIPHNHISTITSIEYYDTSHTLQTFAPANYSLDTTTEPHRVRVFNNTSLDYSDRFNNPVVVTYTAVVDDDRFEISAIIQATVMIAADLWYNRSNSVDERMRAARLTAERILAPISRTLI